MSPAMAISQSELRAHAVELAVAADFNDELTIILCAAQRGIEQLPVSHPIRSLLLDIRTAGQNCAWKATMLMHYAAQAGARPRQSGETESLTSEPPK
jgi:hypothetical protein